MTRARILADYVSSGDELALKAPLAGPTFTGTVAIPNVANLETAVVANTAKVTNANPTLADINALDVTELGTVTSGNLSNTAIVYPAGHIINYWKVIRNTSGTGRTQTVTESYVDVNINGAIELTGVTATEGNILRATFGGWGHRNNADGTYVTLYQIHDGTNRLAGYEFYSDTNDTGSFLLDPITLTSLIVVPASFTNKTLNLQCAKQSGHPQASVIDARCLTSIPNSASNCDSLPFFELMEIQV